MKTKSVIFMGAVRELLSELDKLRADVLSGQIEGWGGSVTYADGREVIYLGGSFREDSASSARAMLRVSAERALRDNYLPADRATG